MVGYRIFIGRMLEEVEHVSECAYHKDCRPVCLNGVETDLLISEF
jgi:hypothetical protein